MRFVKLAAVALAVSAVSAPVYAKEKPVELSATELAAIQSKTVAVPLNTAFAASIATLQSLGYSDINASKDAGTISAMQEGKGKLIYNIFWGFGKKKTMQKASLLVEEMGNGQSTIRLNIHLGETKARVAWGGQGFTDGKLVKVAEPYQDFFQTLDGEISRRVAANAPASATAPVTTAEVPVATAATTNK